MVKKTTFFIVAATLLAGSMLGARAWAGSKWPYPVYINTAFRSAAGAVGSVRNSADGTQYISCRLYTSGTGNAVSCYANDAAGTFVSCTATAANYVTVMSAITSASHIQFSYDANGNCTELQVSTSSEWEPPK
ncbi:hypothetical protein ATI61_107519 [Archangium gephyra]|uniref:Uncharacterized protein n=1 Tax=Archangium gephyra TaxID=48 RepID=A0AAC8TJN2_9BACT|nr:hypothetical protein [Archangium gephyra]AKJ08085.1 Hypothetical protein AA314_09711 [Archangium gephyra]REG29822.1 hypothetical protein ATI61_107519 [Archangium gephyra]